MRRVGALIRCLYSLLVRLLVPYALLHLWLRGRRQPDYRRHIPERFGFYKSPPNTRPLIWIHAVSVGEARAAEPLIAALLSSHPRHRILLTHTTPTGRETRSQTLDRCERCYLPYDLPGAVARFIEHFNPVLGVLMETEIWPNLIAASQARHIPLLLGNARLSERSARKYARFGALTRTALNQLAAVLAQSEADAARLITLGAASVSVMGNLKFDLPPQPTLARLGQHWRHEAGRPVVLAASTREGEESLILEAWQQVHDQAKTDALLVIVPRHPQRFDEVAALAERMGLRTTRRSKGVPTAATQLWLGDSMGEMPAYFSMAETTLMGGSFLDYGSQNLIEACMAGSVVVLGPSTFNFADAARNALQADAALQVADAPSAIQAAQGLLNTPERLAAMSAHAQEFARAHQGATLRLLDVINTHLA